MKTRLIATLVFTAAAFGADPAPKFRTALPGYTYQFPRDHFSHPDFQTEWWYYTGNLRTSDGRRFGFELTFFRHAVDDRNKTANVWGIRDVWLAHFALSDMDGNRFLHTGRLNRSGAGLAGAGMAQSRVWNGNWFVEIHQDNQKLEAIAADFRIALELRPVKGPVIHGANGVSQKAGGAGRASHYISFTRLATRGTLTIAGQDFAVEGLSWMDHEFFTHQLEANQTGWDWFSLQFGDGSELMLFRLRRKDGRADPYSAGTYVDRQGRARNLKSDDFEVTPGRTWTSPATHGVYPIEWTVRVPSLRLDAALKTRLPQQELTSTTRNTTAYWEGAIEIAGSKEGRPVTGSGYLEMTGYAGPVRLGM